MSGVVWELIPWNDVKGVIVWLLFKSDQGNSDTQAMEIEAEESE